VVVETERKLEGSAALDLLRRAAGVRLCESPGDGPALGDAVGSGEVWVGGVREVPGAANGLRFWLTCDNLLKGSALNAVQIAELILRV
jgi:aspartate-semialdehyde dehydrogenase